MDDTSAMYICREPSWVESKQMALPSRFQRGCGSQRISPEDLRRLTALPNVILTPRVASNRVQTRLSMWYLSGYLLMAWLLGYHPTNVSNPQVYS